MRYFALAVDFDGTLAHNSSVDEETVEALKALRKSGRSAVMVTGRIVDSLSADFDKLDLFDFIVAENGAVLYEPKSKRSEVLAQPPPPAFIQKLKDRGVSPLEVGDAIVATWEPHEQTTVEAIRELGLELQVIFNKGAVMVLPSGTNKATGLRAALERLGISPHNAVGVGDAENDHAFLQMCEVSAAVANALPSLISEADIKLAGDHGRGVTQLINALVSDDLKDVESSRFTGVPLGRRAGRDVMLDAYIPGTVLIAGQSGGGKSTLAIGLIERLIERDYQVCVIDPEGDHSTYKDAVVLGDAQHSPSIDEIEAVLREPQNNLVVNLLAVPIEERPVFFTSLMTKFTELRAHVGRPHWIALDEAHHLLPSHLDATRILPRDVHSTLAVTVRPPTLSPQLMSTVSIAIGVGENAKGVIREALGEDACAVGEVANGNAAVCRRGDESADVIEVIPSASASQRHRRKYADGDLAPEKSFYFSGSSGKLRLRAANLKRFVELAAGIDDETWTYHLKRADYERWFEDMLGDEELARVARTARNHSPQESRRMIEEIIRERYTTS